MKSILLPVEPHDRMQAAMETAWLLAGRFGASIDGVLLRPSLVDFVVPDPMGALVVQPPQQDETEATAKAASRVRALRRRQDRRRDRRQQAGDALARRHHRRRCHARQHRPPVRHDRRRAPGHRPQRSAHDEPGIGAVRERPADHRRPAPGRPHARHQRADPLERQHRDGARHRLRDAAAEDGREASRSSPSRVPSSRGPRSASWSTCCARTASRPPRPRRQSRATAIPARSSSTTPASSAAICWSRAPTRRAGCKQMIFGGATNHILSHTHLPTIMAH